MRGPLPGTGCSPSPSTVVMDRTKSATGARKTCVAEDTGSGMTRAGGPAA